MSPLFSHLILCYRQCNCYVYKEMIHHKALSERIQTHCKWVATWSRCTLHQQCKIPTSASACVFLREMRHSVVTKHSDFWPKIIWIPYLDTLDVLKWGGIFPYCLFLSILYSVDLSIIPSMNSLENQIKSIQLYFYSNFLFLIRKYLH